MTFKLRMSLAMYVVVLILFRFVSPIINYRFGILGIPLSHFTIILLPLVVVTAVYGHSFKSVFMLNTIQNPGYVGKGVALWFLALVLSSIYSIFAMELFDMTELTDTFTYLFSNMSVAEQVIIMALIPAVIEELMFRGFLLSSFLGVMKPAFAVMLSALLFAIMHFSAAKLVTTFMLGAVFAYTAYKTKSVYSSMLLHFMNNMLAVLAQMLASSALGM